MMERGEEWTRKGRTMARIVEFRKIYFGVNALILNGRKGGGAGFLRLRIGDKG